VFSSNNHRDSESAEKIMGRSPEDSKLGEAALQLESPCLVTMAMNDIGRCADTLRPYKMGGYAKLGGGYLPAR
jgi:hypothetical protein